MGFFNRAKKDETKKAAAGKPAAPKAKAPEPKPAEAAVPAAPVVMSTGEAHRVLVRPLVTEKGTAMAKEGKYVFEISARTNKLEIKKAVKAVYGVDAKEVRVMTVLGKPVRSRTGYGRRSDWRKAVVTLKKGQSIDLFASKA